MSSSSSSGVLFALALAAVSLAGCGHVETREMVLRPNELTEPKGRAEIYVGAQKPPRPVYEVALLQAFATGDSATLENLTGALAARAGQLGCDAVLRVRVDTGRGQSHAYGVCARYGRSEAPASAPPEVAAPPPEAPEPAEAAPEPPPEPVPRSL